MTMRHVENHIFVDDHLSLELVTKREDECMTPKLVQFRRKNKVDSEHFGC